ncbi:MAG: hypothetical protein KDA89_01910 [Planctomycetaceae bacterium]|nr:hypothetical protein [Planctomycetaceae bacterium]
MQLLIDRVTNDVGNDEYRLLVDGYHMGTVEQTQVGVTQFRGNPDRFQRDPLTGNENGFGPTELFGLFLVGEEIDAPGGTINDVRINGEQFEIDAGGIIPAVGGPVGMWSGDYTVHYDPLTQTIEFAGSITAEFSGAVTGELNIGRLANNHVQLTDGGGNVIQTGDVRFPVVFEFATTGGVVTEEWDPIPTNPQDTQTGSFPGVDSFETTVNFSGDVNVSDPLQVIRKPNQSRTVASVGDDVFIVGGAIYTYGENGFKDDNVGGSHVARLQDQLEPLTFSTATQWTPAVTSTVSLPQTISAVEEGDSGTGMVEVPVTFSYDEHRGDTIEPYVVGYSVTNISTGTFQEGSLQFSGTETQQVIPVTWAADTQAAPDQVFQIEILAVDSAYVRPATWVTELTVTNDDPVRTQIAGLVFDDPDADGFFATGASTALGLTIDSRGTFYNAYRQQEHWFHSGSDDWAALLPDGRVILWDQTPGQITGSLITQVDPRIQYNPALLTQQQSEVGRNGVTVELLDASGAVVQTTVTAEADIDDDGTMESGAYVFDVTAGTYSVRAVTTGGMRLSPGITDSLAKRVYDLDTAREFVGGELFENWGGLGEKWIRGNNGWHYVTPDGAVYQWNDKTRPGNLSGQLVETLSPEYYHHIDLLFAAENPLLSLQTGDRRFVNAGVYQPAAIVGSHFDDADADGVQDSEDEPVNGITVRLTLPNGGTVAVTETADIDLDENGTIDPQSERGRYQFSGLVPGEYRVEADLPDDRISTEPTGPQPATAFLVQQTYQLTTTGHLFENWGGSNERWLFGRGGWYFLTPDGRLWQWDRRSGLNGQPVTGDVLAELNPFYYTHIEFLYNAVDPSLTVQSGSIAQRSFSSRSISAI